MTVPDPLLRLPDETLIVPAGLSDEKKLEAVFSAALDYVNLHAMAWPAANADGALVPPPAEHVLHELAHAYDLADEEDLMINPRVGTVGVTHELPPCDFCGDPARYDAMITFDERRVGANLCTVHYRQHGSMTLGAGGDGYLMLWEEVPQNVQDTCNMIMRSQGREPLF